jgi:hypothetical protein
VLSFAVRSDGGVSERKRKRKRKKKKEKKFSKREQIFFVKKGTNLFTRSQSEVRAMSNKRKVKKFFNVCCLLFCFFVHFSSFSSPSFSFERQLA